MTSKRNDTSKGGRRSGRSRRKLNALYLVAIAGLGIALVAVLTLGNREGGASADQIAGATGTLSAPRTFYDFGTVSMHDGKVTYRYPLRNDSGAPALVEQIFTSCMCTEASLLVGAERLGPFGMQGHGYTPRINRVIPAGQEAVVEAVFDPNAHGPAGVGRNDRAVSILMGGRQMLQLQFTAYVTP
jgi:Protein of unknown function (DUF1573)